MSLFRCEGYSYSMPLACCISESPAFLVLHCTGWKKWCLISGHVTPSFWLLRTATEVRNKEKRSENHEIELEQVLSIVGSVIKIIIVIYVYIIAIYELILLLSKLPIALVDIVMYVIREYAI